ncbi:MAG: hypothetical protein JW786_14865 [Desulfobacterales bacterium]|nr:hypothetical protein [Desulfobacterales bacterium]
MERKFFRNIADAVALQYYEKIPLISRALSRAIKRTYFGELDLTLERI